MSEPASPSTFGRSDVDVDELCVACRAIYQARGLDAAEGRRVGALVLASLEIADPMERWRHICARVLDPAQPFEVHRLVFERAYADWDRALGPAPAWVPDPAELGRSNLGRVMNGDYVAYHRRSVVDPEGYWSEMLGRLGIVRAADPTAILDTAAGPEHARWLGGMRLNIAESVFARNTSQTAVVWRREGQRQIQRRTLGQLQDDAQRVACALVAHGFCPGDALAIDMPMTYESVAIYLGIVMFGGVVVSIADSFASDEIAIRLRISDAAGIFTQDVILRGGRRIPLYERVVAADSPRAVVVAAEDGLASALRAGDVSWSSFLAAAEGVSRSAPFFVCDADAPTNILFSSGTTGDPKAIVWSHITPIKAAADGWAHHDIRAGDVVAWPTNLGWMMGPWLIYASLLGNAAIALFDGSPLGREYAQFVADAGVTMLGVVPSLVKAWMAAGATDGVDWSKIRAFSSTGEASSPDDMLWLMSRAGYKPVIEYCGGTEIGGGYIAGTVVQPQAPSTFSTPALGCDFVILDESGRTCDNGELVLIAPILGSSNRLLNRDHHQVYFADMPRGPNGEVLRRHGDQMERLPGGYYRAHGRVDDTMNLGGIKTSSAEIERALSETLGVRETAAIAVPPPGGGPSLLVIYAVLDAGVTQDAGALRTAMSTSLGRRLNPLFKVHDVVVVEGLPRTASNKVMRRVLRQRFLGHSE